MLVQFEMPGVIIRRAFLAGPWICGPFLFGVLMHLDDKSLLLASGVSHIARVFLSALAGLGKYPATLSPYGGPYGFWQHCPLSELGMLLRQVSKLTIVSLYELAGGHDIAGLQTALVDVACWGASGVEGAVGFTSLSFCVWYLDGGRVSSRVLLSTIQSHPRVSRVEVLELALEAITPTSYRLAPFGVVGRPIGCLSLDIFAVSIRDCRVKFRCFVTEQDGGTGPGIGYHGTSNRIPPRWMPVDGCTYGFAFIVGVRIPNDRVRG